MSRWLATRLALAGFITVASAAASSASDVPVAPMPHTPVKPFITVAFTVNFDFEETLVPSAPQGVRPVQTMPPCCAFDRCEATFAVAPMPRTAVLRPEIPAFQTRRLTSADCRVTEAAKPQTGSLPTTDGEGGGFQVGGNSTVSNFVFTTGQTRAIGSNRNLYDQGYTFEQVQVIMPPSPAIQRCEGVLRQPALSPCQHVASACAPPAKSPDMRVMYPLVGVTAVRRDETGTWWAEVHGIPQPKLATPAATSWSSGSCLVSGPVVEVRQASAVQAVTTPTTKAGELSGMWVREIDGIQIGCAFTGSEMKLTFRQTDGNATLCLTMIAEYAVTKEGLVHGVVTGVDTDVKCGAKGKTASSFASDVIDVEFLSLLQGVIDSPFSFRVKSTSAGMVVTSLKTVNVDNAKAIAAMFGGIYQSCKDGKLPALKAMEPGQTPMILQNKYSDDPNARMQQLPSGRYLEKHHPQYFPPDSDFPLQCELASQEVAVAPMPRRVGGAASELILLPPPCVPLKPTNVPGEAFDVMSGVFGEMLNAKPGTTPCPVLPTAYSVPLPAQPVVVAPPGPLHSAPKPGFSGTWVREIGPIVYVVQVVADHVTITATSSVEGSGGKTYTEGIVLTADFHLTRDGTTVVGLITSVDAVIEGTMPTDADMPPNGNGEELSRIQKLLVDKPLAFNVRIYGDVMAIGNVRLPDLEGARGPCYPLMVIGGRYSQHGDKPLPKPKAVKMHPREILPTPLTATPNTNYIPSPVIIPTSGTLPVLPLNVPNDLPLPSQPPVSIPNPWNPVGVNSIPLLPAELLPPPPPPLPTSVTRIHLIPAETAVAPSPREVTKPRKKWKKPASTDPLKEARSSKGTPLNIPELPPLTPPRTMPPGLEFGQPVADQSKVIFCCGVGVFGSQ